MQRQHEHVAQMQVATFTTTAMAAERCLAAQLPIATSQAAAEDLLQETAEAQQAKLALKGIFDLRGLLEAASRKRVLHPVHLDAIACTLEVRPPDSNCSMFNVADMSVM